MSVKGNGTSYLPHNSINLGWTLVPFNTIYYLYLYSMVASP
jgi:hypothetical protein